MVFFWMRLLFRWMAYLSVRALFMSAGVSLIVTSGIFIFKGMPSVNSAVIEALLDIFTFWLLPLFVLIFLLNIPFSLNVIFNCCVQKKIMRLYCCDDKQVVKKFTLVKQLRFFRGWFMLMAWVLISETIGVMIVNLLFDNYFLEGITMVSAYMMFLIAGGCAFYIMFHRFDVMKIEAC